MVCDTLTKLGVFIVTEPVAVTPEVAPTVIDDVEFEFNEIVFA